MKSSKNRHCSQKSQGSHERPLRRQLAKPGWAHVVAHRSFTAQVLDQMAAHAPQAPQAPQAPFGARSPAFLPHGVTIEGLRYRDLFGFFDTLWGIEEIWWRVAHRRLNPSSPEAQRDDLIRVLEAVPWSHWLPSPSVHLAAGCHRSVTRSSGAVKEAFAEVLKSHGVRPSSKGLDGSEVTCRVALHRDTVSVYVPAALEPWHRRAYKGQLRLNQNDGPTHLATLREDCAQAMIGSLAQWLGRAVTELPRTVLVPFAGTGTLALEYLSVVWQLGHSLVGCHSLLDASTAAPHATLAHHKETAARRACEHAARHPVTLWCCDWNQDACTLLHQNYRGLCAILPKTLNAHVTQEVHHADVFGFDHSYWVNTVAKHRQNNPLNPTVCLLLNPPFGERLARNNPARDYTRIAKLCKEIESLAPITGVILCPDEKTTEAFRLGLAQRIQSESLPFSYGTLKASVVRFCSPGERALP